MTRPRLLDLFCGAGGCSVGYHRAGFDVVGVDNRPMPLYPFEFHQADALEVLADRGLLAGFDAVHASPPCQSYSRSLRHLATPQPMLIDAVRDLLQGHLYVIENVEGSPLPRQDDLFGAYGVQLCGTSFGMRVWRHRLFETSVPVPSPGCAHRLPALNPHNQAGRDAIYAEFGRGDPEKVWRKDMGVEWMSKHEAREAIPPAYTQFIGEQLLTHLRAGVT